MPSSEQKWIVGEDEEMRVDRFLVAQFPSISRAFLQELIKSGKVRVNSRTIRKGTVLKPKDEVAVDAFVLPEERRISPNPEIPLKIVFENEGFAVIEKPAGLPTHPNDFLDRNTVANAAIAHFPEMIHVGDDSLRPGIVHRLDSNTSGLLLLAKTSQTFDSLRALFNERKIHKTYQALVLGKLDTKGEISLPIAHHPTNPRRMIAIKKGVKANSRVREAKTFYEPIESFEGCTLLSVRTLTGRMHQVRVHLSAIGNSLVGDLLYQSPKERLLDQYGLNRHFLHAAKLEFELPDEQKPFVFKSELPEELSELLRRVRIQKKP